jgi:2-(1,2-epoxy-1,2-dihydrophenyl)acetyl-CoA isomerase
VSLALACDLVYASDQARFVLAFARIGLVPDSGTLRTLVRVLGRHRAAQLAFRNDPLSAADAADAGLINGVVPADDLIDHARAHARELASGPTRAIGLTKRLINASENESLGDVLVLEAALQELAGRTDDHAEGVSAFTEKRDPRFTGH